MSDTATKSPASATGQYARGEVTRVAEDNLAPSNWRGDLLVPWHLRSAISAHGNEVVSDLRVWSELADRARRRWEEDNPY